MNLSEWVFIIAGIAGALVLSYMGRKRIRTTPGMWRHRRSVRESVEPEQGAGVGSNWDRISVAGTRSARPVDLVESLRAHIAEALRSANEADQLARSADVHRDAMLAGFLDSVSERYREIADEGVNLLEERITHVSTKHDEHPPA